MVILKKTVTQRVLKKVAGDVTVSITSGLAQTAFLGSAMTGSEGSGRTYVHSSAILAPGTAKVYLGTADGGLLLVAPSKWTRSTTTITNDTLTLNVYVANTDTVVLET